MKLIAPLILFGLSLMMVLIPEKLWKLKHLFTAKGGEPTEFYMAITRIGGAIMMIVAFFLAVFF